MRRFNRIASWMDRKLGRLSLQRKVVLLVALVSFVVLGLSMLASFYIELRFFRERLLEEYKASARMIATNLQAAVAFQDRRDARDILNALSEREFVVVAGAYLSDGTLLAHYARDDEGDLDKLPGPDATSLLQGQSLVVSEPISLHGRPLGQVVLLADLHEARAFLRDRAAAVLILLSISMLIAVVLASRMGRRLTRPILDLASTAQRISIEHDFSTRQKVMTEDETGQLVGAFNEMIAEIERRDELIRASEARFRGYFELGIVGAGILDTDFRWIETNQRLCDMLGYSPRILRRKRLPDLLSDEEGQQPRGLLAQGNSGQERVHRGEFTLRRKDGQRMYVLASMLLVPLAEQKEEHILFLAQDITDRKRYEEGLIAAKERAESYAKAKDSFLSIISHELRTPLNPIIGYVDVLQRSVSDEQSREKLDLIKHSAKHLLELIDDVLEYSRVARGLVALSRDKVNLRHLCEATVGMMRSEAEKRALQLRLSFSFPQGEREVIIDRLKLRQSLLNLLANAIKFTPSGSVEIRVALQPMQEPGTGRLRIEVEDTGIGIDPSERDKVFQPFSQIDQSLSSDYSGIGLGMAITQKLIEAMGGQIDFDSEKGKGTCFWIEAPVEMVAEPSQPPSGSAETVQRQHRPLEGKALLVDDQLINRELARTLIADTGLEVVCAKSGPEAIQKAAKEEFSLIIMDIKMPKMDGYETSRRIRRLDSPSAAAPIIAMTAHITTRGEEDCAAAGMDDFLSKPFDMEKLDIILRKWLGKKSQRTPR